MQKVTIEDQVLLFYNTHIKSVLQYGNFVCRSASKTQIERLNLLQRKATRSMRAMYGLLSSLL